MVTVNTFYYDWNHKIMVFANRRMICKILLFIRFFTALIAISSQEQVSKTLIAKKWPTHWAKCPNVTLEHYIVHLHTFVAYAALLKLIEVYTRINRFIFYQL